MKLYTKTGDGGETGLFGGIRVSKDDPRVAAYGDVDETNAAIGVAAATSKDAELIGRLREIQSDMFALGARLATLKSSGPGPGIDGEAVRRLEGWIDEADAEVIVVNTCGFLAASRDEAVEVINQVTELFG